MQQLPLHVVPFAPDGRAKMREIIDFINDTFGAGDSDAFAALMEGWLAGLPTVDPEEAGKPFLNVGVLTVSSGPS